MVILGYVWFIQYCWLYCFELFMYANQELFLFTHVYTYIRLVLLLLLFLPLEE